MKKTILTLMLCCGFFIAAQAQVLYRISGNGLARPSYIIGTHHLANVAFINSIPGVRTALDSTEQVYGELKMDPASMQATTQVVQKHMMLGEGQKINQVLSADQMKRVNAFMMKTMQTDFNNPAVMQQMGSMSPAALSTNFTVLLYLTHHMGEFDPTNGFDEYFQKQALNNNEPVGGLETAEFQAKVLYGDPLSKQVKTLMCLVDNPDQSLQYTEDLTKAYMAQDTAAIWKAFETKLGNDCDPTQEYLDKLVFNRNADWMGKIPQLMQERPTLFCVGCLHLLGDKGVLALLRKAGYTVEGVK
ncbi:MAG: TraB/GumN family protein [Prevotella sp.]|nr:TraB/GumN family protein [Prevotella sp.]